MSDLNFGLTVVGVLITALSLVVGIVSWRLGKLTTTQISATNQLISKSHDDTRLLIREIHADTLKFLRGDT